MNDNRTDFHPGQIPTERSVISSELFARGLSAVRSLCRCMTDGLESPEYMNHLVAAAMQFERVSCLGFRDSEGCYRKPDERVYRREVFESWAGTPGEVYDRLAVQDMTTDAAEHVYKIIWQIAELVCPMMACTSEQAFISEYAYAIDYVIRHDGDLPKPEIKELFPMNYENYNYTEGVADEIRKFWIL